MTKVYLLKYRGEWLTVSDEEIMDASAILSKNTGIFSEPAATAAFAGMLKYKKLHQIEKKSKNVVLLTGSGLKDLKSVAHLVHIPKAIAANMETVYTLFKKI